MNEQNFARGLELEEIPALQERFGKNNIPPIPGPGVLKRLFAQFTEPLVAILVFSAVLAAFLSHVVDAAVIGGVVVLNAMFGFLQEAKALKALAALSTSLKTTAVVLRGGAKHELDAAELVPGDIVFLEPGCKVPADVEILTSRNLRIDESNLTGESVPVEKRPAQGTSEGLCFASTLVASGTATCRVLHTGVETAMGKISRSIERADSLSTPLTLELVKLSSLLLKVILILALATIGIGLCRGLAFVEVLLAGVSLAVGAIPEGLPAAVTITLAIGVARMAKRNAIIRKLPAVETLGCTTVICTDKTGTLTLNKMTVKFVVTHTGRYELPFEHLAGASAVASAAASDAAFKETVACGYLCNNSFQNELMTLDRAKTASSVATFEGSKSLQGDPTETALLEVKHPSLLHYSEVRAAFPRLDELGFASETQYMATLHGFQSDAGVDRQTLGSSSESGPQPHALIYVKGSVEKIMERCSSYLSADGAALPLSKHEKNVLLARAEELAFEGNRVLAFARGSCTSQNHIPLSPEHVQENLVFLGYQAMIDPPRAEAAAAIAKCRDAGIVVKMITGDHLLTASAIARQLGLLGERSALEAPRQALTGVELAELSAAEFLRAAKECVVFARVTPDQKIALVRALQELGQVVAMTGDGVNDGPALRQANIGVAMGLGGTEVAREAADMILTDDHFATIVAAVEEGRGVFDNLQKFIVWTLPTNLAEGLVILVAIAVGAELPILPVQVLWINMTSAVFLGLTLSFEPKQKDLMQRKPRPVKFSLVPRRLILRIGLISLLMLCCAFGLFEFALRQGLSVSQARTLAINVFVSIEIFYLFNCRMLDGSILRLNWFSNSIAWAGIGVMCLLQLLFNYLPQMNLLFQSEPFPAVYWLPILVLGCVCMVFIEIEKWLVTRTVGFMRPRINPAFANRDSEARGK